MSGTATGGQTANGTRTGVDVALALEVVVLPVADPDRSKDFYAKLGWRLDADRAADGFRVVQMTPPQSRASIIFGEGITAAPPGSIDRILLVVDDIGVARDQLNARGADVGDLFHGLGSGWHEAGSQERLAGRDPDGASYSTFATFADPDGNVWMLQEITERLAGREWDGQGSLGVDELAQLLRETAEHHDAFEKTHQPHDWWDWYAPYLDARERGHDADTAVATANRYMDEVKHVAPL